VADDRGRSTDRRHTCPKKRKVANALGQRAVSTAAREMKRAARVRPMARHGTRHNVTVYEEGNVNEGIGSNEASEDQDRSRCGTSKSAIGLSRNVRSRLWPPGTFLVSTRVSVRRLVTHRRAHNDPPQKADTYDIESGNSGRMSGGQARCHMHAQADARIGKFVAQLPSTGQTDGLTTGTLATTFQRTDGARHTSGSSPETRSYKLRWQPDRRSA